MSAPGGAASAAAALATLKQQELLYFQQQAAALFPFSVAAQQEFVRHAQIASQQQQQLQLQKQQQQLQQQQWAAAASAQQYASYAAAVKQQQQKQISTSTTTTTTPPPPTPSATSAWPPSLKSFVTRALSECTGDSKRTELMEQSLKFLINKHTNAGTLATNPWHLMSIPDIPRTYASVAASTSSNIAVNTAAAAVPQPPTSAFRPPQPNSMGGVFPGRAYPPGRAARPMSANKLILPPLPTTVATTSFQPPPPPPPPEPKAMTRKQKRKLALESVGVGRLSKKAAATLAEQAKRARRAERFDSGAASTASSSWTTHSVAHDDDWDDFVVRGTSQALEKGYLRLTSAPDPSTVRPLAVLVKAFAHVKQRWERENDYAWVCDQLKAIRQDLTVQHIDDEFAVQVYESHARWALESDDLNEFNQCQTQLNKLYSKGVAGARDEFTAYRLIYFVHLNLPGDLARQMLRLTREERENPAIKHALAVCTAVTLSNYQQFFHLHARAPNMSAYLLDYMVPGMRRTALAAICAAYRPTVPLAFVKEALGFAHASKPDNEMMRWLDERGALYDLASGVLQTKETAALL